MPDNFLISHSSPENQYHLITTKALPCPCSLPWQGLRSTKGHCSGALSPSSPRFQNGVVFLQGPAEIRTPLAQQPQVGSESSPDLHFWPVASLQGWWARGISRLYREYDFLWELWQPWRYKEVSQLFRKGHRKKMPPAAGESSGECEAGQPYYLPKTQETSVQGAVIGGHIRLLSSLGWELTLL